MFFRTKNRDVHEPEPKPAAVKPVCVNATECVHSPKETFGAVLSPPPGELVRITCNKCSRKWVKNSVGQVADTELSLKELEQVMVREPVSADDVLEIHCLIEQGLPLDAAVKLDGKYGTAPTNRPADSAG